MDVLVTWWDPNVQPWSSFRFVDWLTLDPLSSSKAVMAIPTASLVVVILYISPVCLSVQLVRT